MTTPSTLFLVLKATLIISLKSNSINVIHKHIKINFIQVPLPVKKVNEETYMLRVLPYLKKQNMISLTYLKCVTLKLFSDKLTVSILQRIQKSYSKILKNNAV